MAVLTLLMLIWCIPSATLINIAVNDHAVVTAPEKDEVASWELLILRQSMLSTFNLGVVLSDVVDLIRKELAIC